MSFAPLIAEIKGELPLLGTNFSCKITRNGKFVSATLHASESAAIAYAKKKKAKVLRNDSEDGTVTA